MPKVLRSNKGAEECLTEFLRFLLESGRVKGVFSLTKVGKSGGIAYSLITDPAALEEALPLFPLMPVEAAKVLSRLTLLESATEPVAAVVRPCELRALVELIKRNQGNLDNFLLISSTCGGVYPLETSINGDIEEKLPQYWDAVKKGEIAPDIRPACMACEHFVPYNADIAFALIGNEDLDKQCIIHLNTNKGEQFADGFAGGLSEGEVKSGIIDSIQSKRQAKKQELFREFRINDLNIQKVFEKCIGCHNCSKVCPVCYCHVCFFDSGGDEHDQHYYETELGKRGYVPVLPDPIFYQLVRLFHVSMSCIGCGLCGDVCPVHIPLWAMALKTGEAVQKAFDYLPGKDINEGLPVTTFKPEEFA
ncbi:MAG: 4Fe-4S binding protein [Dehalococcoidia bacterium]|nr:4Fe-4S binding protein [Dehalococcoidia bacterium]